MPGFDGSLPRHEQARQFVVRMLEVWKVLGIDADLSRMKIDVPLFVSQTLQLGGALEQNPFRLAVGRSRPCCRN